MPSDTRPDGPVISIVTVNYKVPELVDLLIASVPQAAATLSFEIIVVDNASEDGSVEQLRHRHPDVHVVASDVNLGFGRGNNLGVEHARGEILALVNPDVVLPPNSLAALVEFLREHPQIGLVGPRVQLPDGSTQSSPHQLPDRWDVLRVLPGASRAASLLTRRAQRAAAPAAEPCGAVHGSCMIFRREAYQAAGGMASNVFMYGEEPIIGHRIKEAGYEIWYNPLVHVLHQDEACADKRWVPHQKALRKRNGHISARSEIWPRPWSITWNALMAAREACRAAGTFVVNRESSKRHLDFVRLHVSGMKRVKGDASNSLPD
jgi:GT2 family glycosyltransferase